MYIDVIKVKSISIIFTGLVMTMAACKSSHAPGSNKQSIAYSGGLVRIVDSAAYIKGIMANKSKYIHKELGVLLKDLAIPIKSYTSQFSDRLNCSGITLSFDEPDVTVRKSEGIAGAGMPAKLYVEWETYLPRTDVEARLKRAAGNWEEAEQVYYSKIAIKDIR